MADSITTAEQLVEYLFTELDDEAVRLNLVDKRDVYLGYRDKPAVLAKVNELLESGNQQRGLTLISALINFVDWLDREGVIAIPNEQTRAQLVTRFFDAHSEGENYLMQAEQIAEILGDPFTKES